MKEQETTPSQSRSLRFCALCAYDGTDFSGWQSQPGGNTIQDIIQKRLSTLMETPVSIHGSGRTDAGVHALGQVFHFDASWTYGADKLERALRSGLPESIQIQRIKQVHPDFHARFSAVGKTYRYQFKAGRANPFETRYTWSLRRQLDGERMKQLAGIWQGRHDFRHFRALRGDESENHPDFAVRTIQSVALRQRGKYFHFDITGEGFLYKMVRCLVGALVEHGLGKLDASVIRDLLESKETIQPPYQTAPARGLILRKVHYG